MKAEPVAGIQPAVLRWARESIGMSVEDVALKLKRPPEDIRAWESADATAPTYAQLETLAYKVLKRPLAVFFLPEPPKEVSPKREFRTLPDAELQALHADTHMQVRRACNFSSPCARFFDGAAPAERQKMLAAQWNCTARLSVRQLWSRGVGRFAGRSNRLAIRRSGAQALARIRRGAGHLCFSKPRSAKTSPGFVCLRMTFR